MAAHYGVALGHGARWIAFYTLAMGRGTYTSPGNPGSPAQGAHCTAKGVSGAAFTPRLAGNEEGKALENQDVRMLGPKE